MNSCRIARRITTLSIVLFFLGCPFIQGIAAAEKVVVATWNIEQMMMMFDQELMPERSRDKTEYFRDEEDLYEVARTMDLPRLNADIIVIQEGPTQAMLELFNKQWLKGKYEYVKVFTSNTEGQYLGVMAKAGFKSIFLGIENVSKKNLKTANKGDIVDASREAIRICHKYDIMVVGGMIFGFPDDGEQEIIDTRRRRDSIWWKAG